MLDGLLETTRTFLHPRLYEDVARILTRVGDFGLPVAGALGFALATTVAIQTDGFTPFLYGLGWILAVVLLRYIAASFGNAGEGVLRNSRSQLGSFAFPNCFALILLVTGLLLLFGLLVRAVQLESLRLFWLAIGSFLLCEFLAWIAMNPQLTEVMLNPRISPGDEALGIWSFLLKACLRLVPIGYGIGVVVGCLSMLSNLYNLLADDWPPQLAFAAGMRSADLVLTAGSLPLTGFLLFLLLHLGINVLRAILAVPLKLDHLARQLPDALPGPRPRFDGEPPSR
jgi:hypothetical protein